ncbi:hypothetical protein [Paenibacillus aestuarii]|uniref:Spore coat protein n=1 Tax=Paenibacillus aestuarii TaxID=516965 RepID=A0ABW0KIU7_9BACL|nr:hypothetical protein [Paenibacillus aestuarii]
MIKTQDLKLQIDELTKQNDLVLIELEQLKKMLGNSDNQQNNQDSGQGSYQSQGQGQGQNQAQGQGGNQSNQNGNQQASGTQGQGQDSYQAQMGQNQNQGQNQGQGQNANQSGGSNSQQVSDLAYELLKIKDLVGKLEQKTSQYVSSQSQGSLTEKDAVNLVLTLMNGMVDWASEFVSSKASSNGQVQ